MNQPHKDENEMMFLVIIRLNIGQQMSHKNC